MASLPKTRPDCFLPDWCPGRVLIDTMHRDAAAALFSRDAKPAPAGDSRSNVFWRVVSKPEIRSDPPSMSDKSENLIGQQLGLL
jgi:hypothetical protein